ncbi:type IV pilus biogenesis protein PilP [Stenotrophomonas maltophilia]|uniref:type IV pilus biogenesis protein PilP n=1 Tax=Stenotrophomonas maltophilia TaxID=40324 RepID=UPI00244CDBF7|nr:type IV pilus biogenesis protein PilP [Stenotrophomonas maltophilia]MDH0071209.1 type IV pilus biogenesis protein PilP [Stenotrophomonas maltophilia]MDH0104194.1 type IV pilus biogenesis protein PilP [Stenotrophomonas maltophilia]MDH0330156.1 type IV pilus biogenesis protein PilP [Stenotrophomonas maltophilia]
MYAKSLLMLALAAASANAQDAVPTIGELSRIQAETLLLKARAEKAKAQSELSGDAAKGAVAAVVEPTIAPVVSRVYGAGDKLKARFLYEGGASTDEVVGSLIPGDYRVVVISMERVIVERRGKRLELAFSGTPPVAPRSKEPAQPPTYPFPNMPLPRVGG